MALISCASGDESRFDHKQIDQKPSNTVQIAREDSSPTLVRHRPSFETLGIKLHHDNGRPHIHKDVSNYLESEGITIIPQPPKSPYLAPYDFCLFDIIKQDLTME
ncbi:unnamed protein product, partial [Rotaria sp. Silwood1]